MRRLPQRLKPISLSPYLYARLKACSTHPCVILSVARRNRAESKDRYIRKNLPLRDHLANNPRGLHCTHHFAREDVNLARRGLLHVQRAAVLDGIVLHHAQR